MSTVFIYSCSNNNMQNDAILSNDIFEIKNFYPITNYFIDTTGTENKDLNDNKMIFVDYNNAIDGIVIPNISQTADTQGFSFEFSIKNKTDKPQTFYYKIYYQNESYKFPELDTNTSKQHIFAHENFYGSWQDVSTGFKQSNEIPSDGNFYKISDFFKISGNPRAEEKYFENGINHKWKRNPRVGNYKFMIVVTTKDIVEKHIIPDYICNISKLFEGNFVNPFYYFLYGEGASIENTIIYKASTYLKVIAKPDLDKGIYINPNEFPKNKNLQYFTDLCGQNEDIYKNSPFQQFIHYVDASTKMYNIPLIKDVTGGDYTLKDYNWNKRFIPKEELIGITPTTAKYPCQNIFSDTENNKIVLINPASEFGKWEKQNTGVITRHGFVYGKYTIKCKLTELLNVHDMWNGITNALWLISQSGSEWNHRRDCNKEGYMETYWGGTEDKRVKNVGYSEIDFEILKTSPYCPSYSFPPAFPYGVSDNKNIYSWNIPQPDELLKHKGQITVACTNWDMACMEPVDFGAGCRPIKYKSRTFESHRWDNNYRALTQKSWANDNELFGSNYYYFQIDWRPQEIIWRIGPEKDKLEVVGYMNNTVTSIPNNQMLLIITQEFHNTKWWPGTPYSQDNIPFPAKELKGEIYEITIE